MPRARRRLLPPAWLAAGLALGIVVAGHTLQARRVRELASAVDRLRRQASELGKQVVANQRQTRAQAELAARLGLIERLGRERGHGLHALRRVGESMSDRILLSEFDFDGKGVMVAGTAGSVSDLTSFLARLESTDSFRDLNLLEMRRKAVDGSSSFDGISFVAKGRLADSFASPDAGVPPAANTIDSAV